MAHALDPNDNDGITPAMLFCMMLLTIVLLLAAAKELY